MIFALQIIQIVISITLIALILLQGKGSGLSSVFGGGGGVYHTKRGVEKTLYQATIGLSIVFFAVAIAILMLS